MHSDTEVLWVRFTLGNSVRYCSHYLELSGTQRRGDWGAPAHDQSQNLPKPEGPDNATLCDWDLSDSGRDSAGKKPVAGHTLVTLPGTEQISGGATNSWADVTAVSLCSVDIATGVELRDPRTSHL